ncbi:MAG: dTDP-4-dehydrorhamnose 3,5-epimerase [Gammaproteobacteria bacterium RIFCSPHIGHO2_12_FULL_38_14]|nr:MAG: dTDP-4-dehydrorhamnose 3,5-epimerase [Gammaproteobacteria bacterium RIFCSPHIGHO2_12_FULL_38_14]
MNNLFNIINTSIPSLKIIQRNPLGDQRGYLERLFCSKELGAILPKKPIVQINHTYTKNRGAVRGMHFQYPPYTETKLVSCIRGEVFDVAIDLRNGSPTFLQYHAEILTDSNHKTFVIPDGFAHGFQTLTDDCELLYFHTSPYHKPSEGGLNALDPRIGIPWPLPITDRSERDLSHPMLTLGFKGIE